MSKYKYSYTHFLPLPYNGLRRAVMGYKTGPCIRVFEPMPRLVSDCNVFYIPEEHRGTIGKLPDTDRLFRLQQWQDQTGLDRNSIEARPVFKDPHIRDFSPRTDSPETSVNGRPSVRVHKRR